MNTDFKETLGPPTDWNRSPTNRRPIKFMGWHVGHGATGYGGNSGYACDWNEGRDVDVYLTTGGRYLLFVQDWSRWQGAPTSNVYVGAARTPDELLTLLGGGHLGQAEKEAWVDTCKTIGHDPAEHID